MAEFRIVIEPTARKEIVGGIEFRVFKGMTTSGIKLEMLGLFRITNFSEREEFERTVCAVAPGDPPPVTLLTDSGLVRP